jgi:hypothetical protein
MAIFLFKKYQININFIYFSLEILNKKDDNSVQGGLVVYECKRI